VLRRRGLLAAVALAVAAGCLWTRILYGGGLSNAAPELYLSAILDWGTGVLFAVLMPGEHVPWLQRVGGVALLAYCIVRRQPMPIAVYIGGLILLTVPYAFFRPFAMLTFGPTADWETDRYGVLWFLFPIFFGAWGIAVLSEIPLPRWLAIARTLILVLLFANVVPYYFELQQYQYEYVLLRHFLERDRTTLPLVVPWEKCAGLDFVSTLSAPPLGLIDDNGGRDWWVLKDDADWEKALRALPGRAYVYDNGIADTVVMRPESWIGDNWKLQTAAVRRYGRFRCLVQRFGRKVFSATDVPPSSLGGPWWIRMDRQLPLAIYEIDPHASDFSLDACPE